MNYFQLYVNKALWNIKFISKEELFKIYNESNREEATYVFGVTIYPEKVIYINKEMNEQQIEETLIHELTHCYIWEYGLYNAPSFNHEMACDLVSSITPFINECLDLYELYIKEGKNE